MISWSIHSCCNPLESHPRYPTAERPRTDSSRYVLHVKGLFVWLDRWKTPPAASLDCKWTVGSEETEGQWCAAGQCPRKVWRLTWSGWERRKWSTQGRAFSPADTDPVIEPDVGIALIETVSHIRRKTRVSLGTSSGVTLGTTKRSHSQYTNNLELDMYQWHVPVESWLKPFGLEPLQIFFFFFSVLESNHS